MNRVTFVTPSYAADIERFSLQRESIERCGIEIPQVALVNHEDVSLFERIPFKKNLTIISTREILPPRIERRRLAWGARRREPRYWLGLNPIHGWMLQQLLKLAAPAVVQTEGLICLDSDTLFVNNVCDQDFYSEDGRLHLYETEDIDAEMAEWYIKSLRFLGLPVQEQPLRRFTHSPVPFHRDVLLAMHEFIEKRHGKHWMEAMLDAEQIFEYSTYGAFATYIDAARHVAPVRPSLCLYYWWSKQANTIQDDFLPRLRAANPKAVLINSNMHQPVAAYRHLIEQAWELTVCNLSNA
jgi:Family of unknown function (DUF6492)